MCIMMLMSRCNREMLGGLEESFSSLETASKGMVEQVRYAVLSSSAIYLIDFGYEGQATDCSKFGQTVLLLRSSCNVPM